MFFYHKKGSAITPPSTNFDQKLEQLQQKFQMQNQEDLNKIFNNKLAASSFVNTQVTSKVTSSQPLMNNMHQHQNKLNENNNQSFSDSTNSSPSDENEYGSTSENQQKYYDPHDISDLDLGYTKRQSCEYYDDVKRNLKFDDDDDDDESSSQSTRDDVEIDMSSQKQPESTGNVILAIKNDPKARKAITKPSSLQTANKVNKAPQKDCNGTKSLNSSISTSVSLNSIVNAIKPANQAKQVSNRRVSTSHVNTTQNSSSQNRSMISLIVSPNQTTSKHSGNQKEVPPHNKAASATLKTQNAALSSSNKRIWKYNLFFFFGFCIRFKVA